MATLLLQPPRAIDALRPRQLPASTPFDEFAAFANEHYLPVAAVQMCLMRSLSDVFAQWYAAFHEVPLRWMTTVYTECANIDVDCESHFALNLEHVAVMGLVGLITSGFGGALWLRHLENELGPTDGSTTVAAKKTLCDFSFYAPTVNAVNLALVPLLCGHAFNAELVDHVVSTFPSLMQLELLLFGPFNLMAFSLIPPELRPTAKAMLSFVFSVGLSIACA